MAILTIRRHDRLREAYRMSFSATQGLTNLFTRCILRVARAIFSGRNYR